VQAAALFASEDNWTNLTLPGLASLFPLPQRYYVPKKIRDTYQPRLENAGLWSQASPEEETVKKPLSPFEKELQKRPRLDKKVVKKMFEKEKVRFVSGLIQSRCSRNSRSQPRLTLFSTSTPAS